MRRRRRYQSQTIHRRKNTQTGVRPVKSPSGGRFSAFLKVMFYLILFAAISYGAYAFLYPRWVEYQAQLKQKPAEKPPLPTVKQKPPQDKEPPLPPLTPIERRTQVEVLNGCGEQGVAKTLADILRQHNYDVVNSGNYIEKGKVKWDVPYTRLIDQLKTQENLLNTKKLAKLLGLSTKRIESYENPAPIADITIIIGKDYKSLPIFKP